MQKKRKWFEWLPAVRRELDSVRKQGEDRLRLARRDFRNSIEAEIARRSRPIDDLLPKLMRLRAERQCLPSGLGERYRLSVDFDTTLVETAFYHGNSQHVIDYIAERLAYMAARELKTMNFQRPVR